MSAQPLISCHAYILYGSLIASQISLGRGIWLMIDMFHLLRDLIAEQDHRSELQEAGEIEEFSDESVSG